MSLIDTSSMVESLDSHFPGSVLDTKEYRGESTILISKDKIKAICNHLKNELGFTFLADLTAVDYKGVKFPRYEMVYHVHRFGDDCEDNSRFRIKCELPENDTVIDSVTPVWRGADWLEREVYDMFGIKFTGHPDPRRILMPEEYTSYPLRKDFDVRDRSESKQCFERELSDGAD